MSVVRTDREKKDPSLYRLEDRIDQALLGAGRVFLSGAIDDELAEDVIKKLWYLELSQPGKEIILIINSPGGSVDSGFAIWDQVKMLSSPITTLVTGLAASMGSVLSLCAPVKKRFATPHARIMLHQPLISGTIHGQASDLEIHAKEILNTRRTLVELYAQETGKDADVIERIIERDTWMTAEEALEFGLLSAIVSSSHFFHA